MKLFQDSRGFIIAFGFDMLERRPSPRRIGWCDPSTGKWEMASSNVAGYFEMGFQVAPEFIIESDGKIIAYQPGRCIEMTYIGGMSVWNIRTLEAERCSALAA